MPNYCNYEMKILGSKKSIQRVIACLEADYNYIEGKPSHKHFFRVFDVFYDEPTKVEKDTYEIFISGDCAWSVYCCMCSGNHTYYKSCKEEHPEIFMGTTLLEQSRDCEIEVFSEEEGMAFSEHYIFKNGEMLVDDCVETKNGGYDEEGNETTEIDWDTYEGDYVCLNPHRENLTDIYRWEI